MPISTDLFTLRTLTDTVLIGPRAAFGRGHRYALQSSDGVRRHLQRVRSDPTAMARIRRLYERWDAAAAAASLSDPALIERIVADARRGRLALWAAPNGDLRAPGPPDTAAAQLRIAEYQHRVAQARNTLAIAPAVPAASGRIARLDVAAMSIEARLTEILHRAVRSDRLSAEAVSQLKAMIEPEEIAKTVAVLAVWAGSHAVGIGFFVDLVLLGLGAIAFGWSVIEGARRLKKFVEITVTARSEADLDLAAEMLVMLIVALGIRAVESMVRRGATRLGGVPAKRRGQFDKSGGQAPPADKAKRVQPPPGARGSSGDSGGRGGSGGGGSGGGGGGKPPSGGEGGSSPAGAKNRALHEKQKTDYRRAMAKPHVDDPKLRSIIDSNYRANATIGSGSTADAVRAERATGQPTGGRWHTQKAKDTISALDKWLEKNPTARPGDRAAAENVRLDLDDALR